MARSPLTETYERVNGMVAYVRENLNPGEYDLFLDMIAPESLPEVKKPVKKSSKKAGKKSARASGMAAAISGSLQRGRGVVTGGDGNEDDGRCAYVITEDAGDGGGPIVCDALPDNNVHHKRTDPDYHPFQPAASSAPPPSDQTSSEIGKGAAGDAHRAVGSGGSD